MFPKVDSVKAVKKYTLHLSFSDGVEGLVDLSHLAGKGVFKQWESGDLFFQVHLDPETNAVVWNEILDLDSNSLYLNIRGLTFEEFKALQPAHASN